MFRRYSVKPAIVPPSWPRGPLPSRYLAGFAVGALGTLYYARQRIYADASSNAPHVDPHHRDDSTHHHNEMPDHGNYHDRIREHSESAKIQGESGIGRIDAASLPRPSYMPPNEACTLTSVTLNPGPTWTFLGLFDAYNGRANKDHIAFCLIQAVLDALVNLVQTHEPLSTGHVEVGMSPPHNPHATSDDVVDKTIKKTFLEIDNAIVDSATENIFSSPSKAAAITPLNLALSGTSALLSFYDLDARLLKVAVAGSARAVLGRRAERKSGDQRFSYYEVHVLTTDQLKNSFEQAQHVHRSDETTLTRGFGLAAYKWSHDIQERVHREYLGDPPTATPHIKMDAEPEITTIQVKPGDFLIMASAGLWQSLTSEEAVGLVGLWLDRGIYHAHPSVVTPVQQASTSSSAEIIHPHDLPVSLGAKDETTMYRKWGAEKRFVCVDINAAGHLVRNALGGADGDLTEALLAVEFPLSRGLRGNVNTAVIFFDGQL